MRFLTLQCSFMKNFKLHVFLIENMFYFSNSVFHWVVFNFYNYYQYCFYKH